MSRFASVQLYLFAFLLHTFGVLAQKAAQYADGEFSYPNVWPSYFPLGAAMNITWDTDFERSNLYIVQNEDWSKSVPIVTNTVNTYYDWIVSTDSTNLTGPFVFRVVNASGTAKEQAEGGFLSDGFYITDNGAASSTSSEISSGTSSMAAATNPTTTQSLAAVSETTSATITSSASASTAASSTGGKSPDSHNRSVQIGIGVGVSLGVIALCTMIFFACMIVRRRRRTKHLYAPPPEMDAADSLQQHQHKDGAALGPAEVAGSDVGSSGHGHGYAHEMRSSQVYELPSTAVAELDGGPGFSSGPRRAG